jgi:anti-sigma factor RsiW
MSDCQFQSRVEAYHDGELPAEGRRAVEEHLARCPICAEELAWLRSVSGRLPGGRGAGLSASQLAGVHAAVDATADELVDASYPISLYRTAGTLMATAASVLIVSCVWLHELPAPVKPIQPLSVAETPAWERVALTLRADPLPSGFDGESYLADARLADWVLRGLAGKPNGNPAHESP